jgi:hypothetical protein
MDGRIDDTHHSKSSAAEPKSSSACMMARVLNGSHRNVQYNQSNPNHNTIDQYQTANGYHKRQQRSSDQVLTMDEVLLLLVLMVLLVLLVLMV